MVQPGDRVRAGQTVAVLEAMKMENEILAEYSGCVVSVNVSEGDRLAAGTEIITIE
jgi:biotin carboxyl carrier protein